MIQAVLLFAVGLVLLIKGGDWFVDGATGIAHRFHLPELLIGATVVSIGTTLPEVMVSATAAVAAYCQFPLEGRSQLKLTYRVVLELSVLLNIRRMVLREQCGNNIY